MTVFVFLKLIFFGCAVAVCELVHNVEAISHLP